jgi:hypothetical protein
MVKIHGSTGFYSNALRMVGFGVDARTPQMFETRDDLAPWVAEVFDRLARINGELSGDLSDDELRRATHAELDRAPRMVTLDELRRGCAIATELMMVEATERAMASLDADLAGL